jgi:hypothetical protein
MPAFMAARAVVPDLADQATFCVILTLCAADVVAEIHSAIYPRQKIAQSLSTYYFFGPPETKTV